MDHFFYGEKPQTLNVEQLEQEAQAVAPEIIIEFYASSTWTSWPYNEKLKQPDYIKEEWKPVNIQDSWSHPDILVFRNVPDQYTKQQVKNFILNHSASETDEAKERRVQAELLIDRIISEASPAKLLELKQALLSAS